jgi:hypothetical protein
MMRAWLGGKPSKLGCFIVLPRKRVLFVLNLTHDTNYVQFSSVRNIGFFVYAQSGQLSQSQINLSKHRGLR